MKATANLEINVVTFLEVLRVKTQGNKSAMMNQVFPHLKRSGNKFIKW
jgi:hypothetical protein